MGNKIIIAIGVLFSLSHLLQAQSINPQTIPTQGSYNNNGEVGISWTLGQTFTQTMPATYQNITLGFQQPGLLFAPLAPAAQTVCSDTAYTFTFSGVSAGTGGNQIEWATNSSFSGATIVSSPANISVTVSVGSTTTIYLRSRVSATGEVSESVSITAQVKTAPNYVTPYCGDSIVYVGSSTNINVPSSQIGVEYTLKINGVAYESYYGNDSIISFTSGLINAVTIFTITASDTATGCSIQLAPVTIIPSPAPGQTLVNQTSVSSTTGSPASQYNFMTGVLDASGNVILVGNTYTNEGIKLLINKYDDEGNFLWQMDYDTAVNNNSYGVAVVTIGTDIYVTGAVTDSTGTNANFVTMKLDHNGNLGWTQTYAGTYGGDDIPSFILQNGSNIYVYGAEQTGLTASEYTIVKYDTSGTQVWVSHWDSSGLINVPAYGAVHDPSNGVVSGFSGTGFSNFDMQTLTFSFSTGAFTNLNRTGSGLGTYTKPVGLQQDINQNVYLACSYDSLGLNQQLILMKFNSQFTELWQKTWSNTGSLATIPTAMALDPRTDFIAICGKTNETNGGQNMVTATYMDSTFLWSNAVSASTSTGQIANGNDIVLDNDDNIFVAGTMTNNNLLNFLTGSYGPNGAQRWLKTYSSCSTCNDIAHTVLLNTHANPIVAGISMGTVDTTYSVVEYGQMQLNTVVVLDTANIPEFIQSQLIVRFDTSALVYNLIDSEEILFGSPALFLKQSTIDSINSKAPDMDFSNSTLIKLSPHIHTCDSIRVSNVGDTVRMPPFWASFLISYPPEVESVRSGGTEKADRDSLNTLHGVIRYAQLNHVYQFGCTNYTGCGTPSCTTVCPTDPDYCTYQYGLHDDDAGDYTDANCNVEEAWNLENGKAFVRVGIFDSGIDFMHEDFQTATNTSKVLGGADYSQNPPVALSATPSPYDAESGEYEGHGTKIAGIVAALRNNSTGIAGIAGGNWCGDPDPSLAGASLFSLKVCEGTGSNTIITDQYIIAAMNDGFIANSSSYNDANMDIGNFSLNTYDNDQDFTSLKENFYYAFRLGKICIACRGNYGNAGPHDVVNYPSCFYKDWRLSVGGSEATGYTASGSLNGENMDIIAPYTSTLSYATVTNLNGLACAQNTCYDYPGDGTSYSAAYATGAAALLLSYMNNPTNQHDFNNLAPEDVEEIIDRTAFYDPTWPGGYTPYCSEFGWGRLDIGNALNMVNKSTSRLLHLNNLTAPGGADEITEVAANVNLQLLDDVPNSTITAGNYLADVYSFVEDVYQDIVLNPGESIQGYWARSSSSATYPLYWTVDGTNELEPYEKAYVSETDDPVTTTDAYIWGYYYDLKTLDGTQIGYIPKDFTYVTPEFSYTIYISGGTVTNVKNGKLDFLINAYPNPAFNQLHLSLTSSQSDYFTINLFNNVGQPVKELFNGNTTELERDYDISDLNAGMYYLQAISPSKNQTLKIIIIK